MSQYICSAISVPLDSLEATWLPTVFAGFDREPVALGAGGRGKHGELDVTFGLVAGQTRLLQARACVPFAVPWVLRADPAWPALAAVYLAMPTGGIVQGDRLVLRLCTKSGGVVHVTTQSATKIYSMERNCATQQVTLSVENDAYVEFWPDPLIPGRGARYGQRTELRLAPTATVLYRDVLMAGRVARGERFAFDVLVSETRGMMQGGDLLFEDGLRLEPGSLNFDANVLLGGYDVLGTLYALNVGLSWLDLAETLDAYFRQVEPVYAGVSILPGRAGLVCRILGRCTGPVLQALETARALIRRELGKPTATPMRK